MICLKNRTFVVSTTTIFSQPTQSFWLWFAWKIVPLWYQQQLYFQNGALRISCDLLEKSYLCGINNNKTTWSTILLHVVICLKNRTFVVSTTTSKSNTFVRLSLWFAWKIVPLWYQQQQTNTYSILITSCDLLEKSYLCGINNNWLRGDFTPDPVVICLKNRTFVVSTTTQFLRYPMTKKLWFAWKIVPLWYQQQPFLNIGDFSVSCDLLEKSYLCGINNNKVLTLSTEDLVVICLKNRTFVVSTTTVYWREV